MPEEERELEASIRVEYMPNGYVRMTRPEFLRLLKTMKRLGIELSLEHTGAVNSQKELSLDESA